MYFELPKDDPAVTPTEFQKAAEVFYGHNGREPMAARSKAVAAAAIAQKQTKPIAFRETESVPMAPKTVTVDLDAVSHQNTLYV